jgi:hypothetical protein
MNSSARLFLIGTSFLGSFGFVAPTSIVYADPIQASPAIMSEPYRVLQVAQSGDENGEANDDPQDTDGLNSRQNNLIDRSGDGIDGESGDDDVWETNDDGNDSDDDNGEANDDGNDGEDDSGETDGSDDGEDG